MQQESSKSIAVAKIQRTGARWTDAQKREILSHYVRHGATATLAKWRISTATIWGWQKQLRDGVIDVEVVKVEPQTVKTSPFIQHTAKHVRTLLRARRKQTEEPDDLETYCWLLIKEILG